MSKNGVLDILYDGNVKDLDRFLTDCAKILVNKGVEGNFSPIKFAVHTNNLERLKCLVKYGAQLQPELLDSALKYSGLDLIKYLIEEKGLKTTEIDIACTIKKEKREEERLEIIDYLLKNGIKPKESPSKWNPLHVLASQQIGDAEKIAQLLIDHGVDVNAQTDLGDTALFIATEGNRRITLEFGICLIANGADVNLANQYGFTPLHNAATKELTWVQLLVINGADIKIKSKYKITALHQAATWGKCDICTYLIGKGADIDAQNTDGNTPIHKASINGHIKMVECLINHGANLNIKNISGNTPLHAAINTGIDRIEIVQILIANGADPTLTNKKKQTPLEMARLSYPKNVKTYNYLKSIQDQKNKVVTD